MQKVNIPEGKSGDWEVEKFTISKKEARMSVFNYGHRMPSAGTYTRLMEKRHTIMSDTGAEQRDHREPVREAKDHILINGLGIGMVLMNCMLKPEVTKATVIELSEDVINLVGPVYKEIYGDRLEIIQANALDWKPPKGIRYGMVWHDIWPEISMCNHPEMKRLHLRYGRRADWQGSWCRAEVNNMVRQDKYEEKQRQMFENLFK